MPCTNKIENSSYFDMLFQMMFMHYVTWFVHKTTHSFCCSFGWLYVFTCVGWHSWTMNNTLKFFNWFHFIILLVLSTLLHQYYHINCIGVVWHCWQNFVFYVKNHLYSVLLQKIGQKKRKNESAWITEHIICSSQ